MTEEDKEKKKGFNISEWVKIVAYIGSILVTSTSLLSVSGNLPSWWFQFSLIFLIALIFSIPYAIFSKPISKRLNERKIKQKRNYVAQKYFTEFKNLVDEYKRFNSPIRDLLEKLKTHYRENINSSLALRTLESYSTSEMDNLFYYIEKELNESDKTFRDLSLIMKQFEFVLKMNKKSLEIIENFAHEMINLTQKPIAKGIEDDFESFREKYNYFVKDFKECCKKCNQELGEGEREFPEWAVDYINKW